MSRLMLCSADDAAAAARHPPLPHPARRLLERRQADAGGVHQRADLHLREVALVLDAAVLDHAHVAALPAGAAVAAHDRTQPPLAVRLGSASHGARSAPSRAAAPARRRPRPRRAIAAGRPAHRPATPAPCRRAHRTPGWSAPAGRAHRTAPCRPGSGRTSRRARAPSGRRARGRRARGSRPAAATDRAGRRRRRWTARRALRYQRSRPPASMKRPSASAGSRPDPGLAASRQRAGAVFVGQQLQRVEADQPFARVAAELDEGRVDVGEAEVGMLQHDRKRRIPEQPDRLAQRGAARHSAAGSRGRRRSPPRAAAAAPNGVRRAGATRSSRRGRRPGAAAPAAVAVGWPAAARVSQCTAAAPSAASSSCSGVAASQGSSRSAAVLAKTTRAWRSSTSTASPSVSKKSRQPCAPAHESGGVIGARANAGPLRVALTPAPDGSASPSPAGARTRHSSSLAAISARSCARLISLTLISSFSAASRKSNSDSLSTARTSSMYGWYGPLLSTSAW